MKKTWRNVIIVLCILIIIGCGCWIANHFIQQNQAQDSYNTLAQAVVKESATVNGETATENPMTEAPTEKAEQKAAEITADTTPSIEATAEPVAEETEAPSAEETAAPTVEATAQAPTFEEWLAATATKEPAEVAATETASVGATPEATEAPSEEEIQAAATRAADENAAGEKYAEVLQYVEGLNENTRNTILRLSYYAWLEENGYEKPDDAAVLEQSMLMDFTELESINPDVIGWLTSENTIINYPVVHGVDNDFYLHHLFDGTANASGTLFTDMYNAIGFTDQNTIIYGHHMRNDSMFATLVNYHEQEYYNEHPVMLLYTPGATYLVELFAGYTVQVKGAQEYDAFQMMFENGDTFTQYVSDEKAKSTFTSDVEVGPEDKIVTLSTCTYEVYNARYIVHGKLTLIAGEEPVPVEVEAEEDTAVAVPAE